MAHGEGVWVSFAGMNLNLTITPGSSGSLAVAAAVLSLLMLLVLCPACRWDVYNNMIFVDQPVGTVSVCWFAVPAGVPQTMS
jgi:hypothetical protein